MFSGWENYRMWEGERMGVIASSVWIDICIISFSLVYNFPLCLSLALLNLQTLFFLYLFCSVALIFSFVFCLPFFFYHFEILDNIIFLLS